MKILASLLTFALVAFSTTSQAAILAGYDFGSEASPSLIAITPTSGVTASNFAGSGTASGSAWAIAGTIGDTSGVAASGTTFGATVSSSFGSTNSGLRQTSLANSVAENDYVGFTITAATAGTLNISGISLDTARANATNNRAADEFNVLAAINGGAFTTANALTTDMQTAGVQASTTWEGLFLDLSGNSTFQGIDSVEFRVYVWGGGTNTGSSRMNFDNVLVEGTVVPEPSTALLGALGALALLRRRR